MPMIFLFGLLYLWVTALLAEYVPEFQFPCYADVCTFPKHFCNSDKLEKRCNVCTVAICAATLPKEIPRACLYLCQKKAQHQHLETEGCTGPPVWEIIAAVLLGLLVLGVLIVTCYCIIQKKKMCLGLQKKPKECKLLNDGHHEECKPLNDGRHESEKAQKTSAPGAQCPCYAADKLKNVPATNSEPANYIPTTYMSSHSM